MYVCICNAVTEHDIGNAVAEGCDSLRELSEQLGVGACCGRCTGCVSNVLKNSLHARAPSTHRSRPATGSGLIRRSP